MAERRMFAKSIIDSDAFVEMPMSARLLYYDLGMRADDDGFVDSPKKIMKMIGASSDDLNILILRKFIIPFEPGVVVIKHWRIHNYIRKDTYRETQYKEQKTMLEFDENNAYTISDTTRQLPVNEPSTQVSIGKDSIGKDRKEKEKDNINVIPKEKSRRFVKPSIEEIQKYCDERKNGIEAQRFYDFYESKGWLIGKTPMKDWKAAVRTWEQKRKEETIKPRESINITAFDVN